MDLGVSLRNRKIIEESSFHALVYLPHSHRGGNVQGGHDKLAHFAFYDIVHGVTSQFFFYKPRGRTTAPTTTRAHNIFFALLLPVSLLKYFFDFGICNLTLLYKFSSY